MKIPDRTPQSTPWIMKMNSWIYICIYGTYVHIIFHSIPFHFSSQEIGNFDFRSCSPLSTCFARSADQSDVVGDSGWAWMNLRSFGPDFEQVTKSQQSIWFFPECVARVPVSLRGLRVCLLDVAFMFATVRNCPQPSATVRNRPREPSMAVPMVSSAKGVTFGYLWRLHMSRCFVSRGMRGTSWHSDVFCKVSKIVLCGRPNTFATFSEDALQFSWRKSRTKCSFWSSHGCVSSRVSSFPVASSCLWRKLQNLSFSKVSKQVVTFCVAGDIPTCVITCPKSFCVAGAILLHSTLHPLHFTLHTLHSTLYTLHFTLHNPLSTLHTLHFTLQTLHSTLHILHFTLHFLHCTLHTLHLTLYTQYFRLYTPHSTLHTLHFTLHTLHSTLHTLHSTLYTPHSTLHTPHSTLYTLHSTLYTPHFTFHTLHSTLYTLHFTLHNPLSTLHTLHFTLHTLHSTLHILHFTLHFLHCTLHTLHLTLYTQYFRLYTPHSTLHTLHFTLHTLHSTLHTLHSTLYTPHSTLHTPHSTLYTLHSTLYTPHFTFHTLHSTLYTLHVALHTLHSTLYTPHSTLHTSHSKLQTLHITLHTPHFTLYTPHFALHALHLTLYTPHSTLHTSHSTLYTLPSSVVGWLGRVSLGCETWLCLCEYIILWPTLAQDHIFHLFFFPTLTTLIPAAGWWEEGLCVVCHLLPRLLLPIYGVHPLDMGRV